MVMVVTKVKTVRIESIACWIRLSAEEGAGKGVDGFNPELCLYL